MIYEDSNDKFVVNMLTYIPEIHGEMKTKPTQTGFKSLMAHGILPDFIFCRSGKPLTPDLKNKISMFCNTKPGSVYDMVDVDHTYAVYKIMLESGIINNIIKKLELDYKGT